MAKPHLTVKEAKYLVIVDEISDGIDGGPRSVFEETIREGLE